MIDYKLVPVEPTPEMLEAARQHHEGEAYLPVSLYKAMLAAAPAVQGEPVGEVRFELGAPSSIFSELYSKSLPALAPGTKLYTAPQPAPDVAGLVEALERIRAMDSISYHSLESAKIVAHAALSAYRKGGDTP